MSASSNDCPVAHDVLSSQRPPLVPGSGAWGQAPHKSTYTWPSWPHVLPGMGLLPTSSPGYTWPPPPAAGGVSDCVVAAATRALAAAKAIAAGVSYGLYMHLD
jgi:hypothetical protein